MAEVNGTSANITLEQGVGLNAAAKSAGKLYFGTATDPCAFIDKKYMQILNNTKDFGQITPENAMKWETIHPTLHTFNFTPADSLISLANANNQLIRCHTLLWHLQLPSWLEFGNFDNATLISTLRTHITTVVSRYRGKCYSWDVVNEVLNDDGTLRDSVFLRTIGPGYLPIAFAAATNADPSAKLYLNEFGIENDYGVARVMEGEYICGSGYRRKGKGGKRSQTQTSLSSLSVENCRECGRRKIEGMKELIQFIRSHGARVDGIGFQSHFEYNNTPSSTTLSRIMKEFTRMDLDVAITELDVRMDLTNMTIEAQKEQATGFGNVVRACRMVRRCSGVTIWEFGDFWGWTSAAMKGWGSALPWDSRMVKKKWVYDAILEGWNR